VPVSNPVADRFAKVFPNVELNASMGVKDAVIEVKREDAYNVLRTAKRNRDLSFDFLRDLCGVDHEAEGLEVVYQLYSYKHRHHVTIKSKVPTEDARIKSVSDVWQGANWHEREVRDMFGIVFEGHPNMVPILLPEDMTDHFPLRKDNPLAPLEEWQGEMLGPQMGNAGYIPPGSGFDASAGGGDASEEEEA